MALFGMSLLAIVIFGGSLIAGLLFIPLIAWTIGPALPYFLAEPLANLIMLLSMLGVRTGVLEQTETDEYVITREEGNLEPRSYWTRFAGAKFGITFEATEEAFAPTLVDETHREELEHLQYDSQGIASVDLDRGHLSWFAHKSDVGKILVPIGQKLAELRDVAGPMMGVDAYAEALKDYGGDTSDLGGGAYVAGTVVMFFGSAMMGYVIFF